MDALDIRGEEEWRRLKTHLEWSEGFVLGFIFSEHPRVVDIFRERLADLYRARVTRLQEWRVEEPQQLQTCISRLSRPTQREQALKDAPIWLDLSRLDRKDESRWRDARGHFLSRLNENREPLRQRQNRPVVLILPAGERSQAKALAPDLWAIRTFCLDTQNWIGSLPAHPVVEPTPNLGAFPLSAYERQLVKEWERLLARHRQQTAQGDPRPKHILNAGFNAFNALYGKRHLQAAQGVAERCLQLARETPEALRDISVSLNNVGKTAQALGRWEDARAAFDESLAMSRQILQRVGETPEALRDLCVSLNNLAEAARAQGYEIAARELWGEALEIGERLAIALPEHEDYRGLDDYFRQQLSGLDGGKGEGS